MPKVNESNKTSSYEITSFVLHSFYIIIIRLSWAKKLLYGIY